MLCILIVDNVCVCVCVFVRVRVCLNNVYINNVYINSMHQPHAVIVGCSCVFFLFVFLVDLTLAFLVFLVSCFVCFFETNKVENQPSS